MLSPDTVYRKTDAGIAEVQARALGLRAELRRLLILIDGAATLGRLAAFVRGSEIDFLIAELEFQGLIKSSAAAATVVRPASAAGLLEPTAAQLEAVRRTAVRTLHGMLGPGAHDLAVKIERCKNANEIRVAITDVRLAVDRQLGPAYGQRFLDAVRVAAEGTR